MIVGCGIDIEELSRFAKLTPAGDDIPGFSRLVFTERELANNRLIRPHLTFPLAFSCKEAFFKAFGRSWSNSEITWKDIEIIFHDENNLEDYCINLNGYALELFQAMNCQLFKTRHECSDRYITFEVILFA